MRPDAASARDVGQLVRHQTPVFHRLVRAEPDVAEPGEGAGADPPCRDAVLRRVVDAHIAEADAEAASMKPRTVAGSERPAPGRATRLLRRRAPRRLRARPLPRVRPRWLQRRLVELDFGAAGVSGSGGSALVSCGVPTRFPSGRRGRGRSPRHLLRGPPGRRDRPDPSARFPERVEVGLIVGGRALAAVGARAPGGVRLGQGGRGHGDDALGGPFRIALGGVVHGADPELVCTSGGAKARGRSRIGLRLAKRGGLRRDGARAGRAVRWTLCRASAIRLSFQARRWKRFAGTGSAKSHLPPMERAPSSPIWIGMNPSGRPRTSAPGLANVDWRIAPASATFPAPEMLPAGSEP